MSLRSSLTLTRTAAALSLLFSAPLWAQTQAQNLQGVTVTARSTPVLDNVTTDVGGFGQPLAKTPQSIQVLGADLLSTTATNSLSQALKLDASLADSYNTTGYVESMSIRGFLLDSTGNFLRNGMPSSNYAPIALENTERIEILKGVSGLQAGVSAPGGLVNTVTKKPQKDAFTTVAVGADGNGGAKLQLDKNTHWGDLGVRVNLGTEDLQSHYDHAQGKREFVSVALQADVAPDTTVSAELEHHHKKQPSVPGLGLLDTNATGVGDSLPPAIYSRLNLNNQTWSQPFDATTTTAQIALTHQVNAQWQARAAISTQRSVIQDRLAFPDGCGNVYPGLCGNGDVDIYDYRSEDEERRTWGWETKLQGELTAMGIVHQLNLGLSGRGARTDLAPKQAYNWVGTTNINTPIALPGDATTSSLNTNSRERTVDTTAALVSNWTPALQSFMGLRTTQLNRSSERSNGSRAISFDQTITTPWAGLSWSPLIDTMVYATWGQGVEVEAVPNRPTLFANAGQVLPALKSEQTELGLKWQAQPRLLVSAALFQIDKPYADDLANTSGLPIRTAGGKSARHQGLELAMAGQVDTQLAIQASLTLLDAKYRSAVNPALVGQTVTNVPKTKASFFANYRVSQLPGVSLNGLLTYEDGKTVTTDGAVVLPSAWQLDAGVRLQNQAWGKSTQWSVNVENLTDRSYWREAPTTYWGGTYLFASTPRTVRARVTVEF